MSFSVTLKGIKKSYNREILKEINLEIFESSYIAIVGKSGSGKSTLMNILGLVEDYDQGEYYFRDILIKKGVDYSSIRLRDIGFIFQNYNLIPTLTCRENILLPTLYSREAAVEFKGLVEKLEIERLLDTSVSVLSGGEKQRVAIARALILGPHLIIADEPTGNLDEGNKEIVLELLQRFNDEGRAVVVITHDFSVARRAKRVLELREGVLHEKI